VHGRRFPTHELVQQATGEPLSAAPLLKHLTAMAERTYGISLGAGQS